MTSAAVEEFHDRIERLERELDAVAAGISLCAISKSAGSVPGAKYLEGRLVAARELARALTSDTDRYLAEELLERWHQALEGATRNRFGPDWVAYRAGGVDELTEIIELWDRARSAPSEPTEGGSR